MILKDVFCIRLKEIELQIERLMDPRLKTRSVAIISSYHSDGFIISLSKEAEEEGLSIGMKVSVIKRMNLCVQLLPYNSSLYNRMNKYLYQTISNFTPIVESIDYEGFYLDMKGIQSIRGDAKNNALNIINCIYQKTNMNSKIGISSNKLVSKIISNVVEEKICEVKKGQEASFLSPLNPFLLPVVKHKSVQRIIKFLWIKKIGSLQSIAFDKEVFQILFGVYAHQLLRQSNGQDSSVIRPPNFRDHILEQTILSEDTNNEDILHAAVKDISQQLAFKLRKRRQIANRIKLEIHYSDGFQSMKFGRVTTFDDRSVACVCKQLFNKANYRRNRIRLILLDASDFKSYLEQTNLFINQNTIDMKISKVIEKIRAKYGFDSIQTADIIQKLHKV